MQYTTLEPEQNQIRLLHVEPAVNKEDDIVCHFSIISLDDKTIQYEALSYVWGIPIHNRAIQLEAASRAVTENLYHALENLRYADRERVIWVDALCIDQSNHDERSDQVSRMHTIYTQASDVVIWLGESWADTELVFDFFKELGSNSKLHVNPALAPSITVDGNDILSARLQQALKEFLALPWWTRIWTVQEWALARSSTFRCGQHKLDGQIVTQCVLHFVRHAQTCCVGLDHSFAVTTNKRFGMVELIDFIRRYPDDMDFINVIGNFRGRQATDPRDKIYGILALANGDYAGVLRPDYRLTVERVFETSALALIERTKRLDILSHIWPTEQRNLSLPSFVPDWTMSLETGTGKIDQAWAHRLGHLRDYDACNHEPADIVPQPGSLAVKGVAVDTVQAVASLQPLPGLYGAFLDEMFALADMVQHPQAPYRDSKLTRQEAFWLAMSAGLEGCRDQDNRPFSRRRYSVDDFSAFGRWNAWYRSVLSPPPDVGVSLVENYFCIVSYARKFMATDGGLVGFVPRTCREGDVVAVLTGGSVPVVLRPDAEGYTVVGDAYVQGVMDGEAVRNGCRMEYLRLY